VALSRQKAEEKARARAESEKSATQEQERQQAEKAAPALAPVVPGAAAEAAVLSAETSAAVEVTEVPLKTVPAQPVQVADKKQEPAPVVPAKREKRSPALREQAIGEYKSVIDRYPGSQAAANAAARLKAIGVIYPAAKDGQVAVAAAAPQENARVLTLEVGQNANIDFAMAAEAQTAEAGKRVAIPFEIGNRGNAVDSFMLESGFPAEYQVSFAAATTPETPISKTPALAPGERFKGVLQLDMPAGVIDGERKLYPIKAFSEFDSVVSQSRPVKLVASAPLLRAVIKTDKVQVLPGEKVQYRVTLLNIGSAAARQVAVRLSYPPQYEPVDAAAGGLKPDGKDTLLLEGVQLASGENRELSVTLQLKDDALAQQELFLRTELTNLALKRSDNFLSTAAFVQAVTGIRVAAHQDKVVVLPGQTVAIPLIITNTGNVRDDFTLKPAVAGNLTYAFYQDLNRDGIRQASEPMINHVGPLAPQEVAHVVMEIAAAAGERDGVTVPVTVGFEPDTDKTKGAMVRLQLVYSRPVLELAMTGKGGKMKPGEVSTIELSCVNSGSSLAKIVEIQSLLPEQLELVASEPLVNQQKESNYVWRFEELGAGEKRSIRLTYRLRSGSSVGTSIALKNVLKYQDQAGNTY
jgi:uncharacterized membrane protein